MKKTKKLGIIGGMGSRACLSFFNKVIEYSPAVRDQDFIEILLHNNTSIPDRTRAIVYGEESPLPEILRSIGILNQHGVDTIVLTCNTSYYFMKEFATCTQATILSPIVTVRQVLTEELKVKKVGLLATTGTVKSRIFHHELEKYGIEVVILNEWEQENFFMQSVYMENGLKSSHISPEAVDLMKKALYSLLDEGVEAIIGGCTEVPLALTQAMMPVPFLDPMDLVARQVVHDSYELVFE